jgi:serine protease
MNEQQERALRTGLTALAATTRGASSSPAVERAVLAEMRRVASPRPLSRAWLPLAAALVIASGVIGPAPTPRELEAHLQATAIDLGPPGRDSRYGAGLLDAAAATGPAA